jgi:hypothetical protein
MWVERAVINSGPLVALSLAGQLDLLPALFGEFWIPDLVFTEVAVAGLGRPGADAFRDRYPRLHTDGSGAADRDAAGK